MAFTIEKITAFIMTDEKDEEGVMGMRMNGSWIPFVFADEKRLKDLLPYAEEIKQQTGKDYRIVQFSVREDITESTKLKFPS